MTARTVLFLSLPFLVTFPAAGQSGWVSMPISPPSPMEVIKGRPYSYEQVSRPGMTIKIFQDAAGRRRTENPVVRSFPPRPDDVAMVEIYDVVAGYRYVLDADNKVAHRSAIPRLPKTLLRLLTSDIASATTNPGGGRRAHSDVIGESFPGPDCGGSPCPPPIVAVARTAPAVADTRPRPEATGESLGTRVIAGLKCEGWLEKTPAGTTETWISKELKIVVLLKSSDPRTGESRITNLSRAEPDASLFQPPPDYKVVDQTGPFRVKITLP